MLIMTNDRLHQLKNDIELLSHAKLGTLSISETDKIAVAVLKHYHNEMKERSESSGVPWDGSISDVRSL